MTRGFNSVLVLVLTAGSVLATAAAMIIALLPPQAPPTAPGPQPSPVVRTTPDATGSPTPEPSPTASPTPEPSPTATPTVDLASATPTPAPTSAPPSAPPVTAPTYPTTFLDAGGQECGRFGDGPHAAVAAGNEVTSCPFALKVREAYLASGLNGNTGEIVAFSPVTKETITMTCEGDQPVQCRGGRSALVVIYGGDIASPSE